MNIYDVYKMFLIIKLYGANVISFFHSAKRQFLQIILRIR